MFRRNTNSGNLFRLWILYYFNFYVDPLWVNIPREVGDGMEAKPDESISGTSVISSETTLSCEGFF